MARSRYRKRRRRFRKKKGIGEEIALYWKSSARRKGALVGMILAPALMATTQFGKQAGKWVGDQVRNLTGQQG